MNTATFLTVFPRQLRYWAIHCALNSSPSFCIALIFLNLWKSPFAIAAMLCAIATFILLYATLTSLIVPLADENHVIARSLKLGTTIRAWISGLSLLVVFTPVAMVTPDFWCGFIAAIFTNFLFRSAGGVGNIFEPSGVNFGFSPVFVTTLLEGFILSFLLLMISFFVVIFIQARDRRRVFAVSDAR